LNRRFATAAVIAVLIGAAVFGIWYTTAPPGPDAPDPAVTGQGPLPRGGSLTGSIRAEPPGFNKFVAQGAQLEAISNLTQAKLVRVNRTTDQVEAWLAESWEASPDSLTYKMKLRSGILFSDGTPLTTDDVLFSFRAAYDDQTTSPIGSALRVAGKPLGVRALGPLELEVTFPAPFGPGIRLLEALPIVPRHKLEAALTNGTFKDAWGPTTPPAEVVGLGPFVLAEYRPGERVVFSRNPHYWRKAPDGGTLPYLDQLVLEILPDQNAELLRLQAGQLDFTASEIRSEDYSTLRRAEQSGQVKLYDLGPGFDADALWFNLASPRADAKDWLATDEFRLAISAAVDRRAYCDTVFLGAATPVHGPVTPGNVTWFVPDLPGGSYDPARARTLLAQIGLQDRDGDAMLDDARGRPARFTILVTRGIAAQERGAAFIRDELEKVGLAVDVVGLESNAVFGRYVKGDYDAIYNRLLISDPDPAMSLDFWLSSGSSHMWAPGQPTPATEWERQIDDLMRKQIGTTDRIERVKLFAEVQRIFSEHMPILYFAAPYQYVATSTKVLNATPSRLRPPILWNPEVLAAAATR
jgi:peptide/nickel transport system substrate-binding protein